MEDPNYDLRDTIARLTRENTALRTEVEVLKFNLRVAIGKTDQTLRPPIVIEPNLMRRSISRVHQAGFMWDASQGFYVEVDARFKSRIKIDAEFRERVAMIRESEGTTMQKLYIDDACLRVENMSLTHEIETVAAAIGAPAVGGTFDANVEVLRQSVVRHMRALAK